MKRGYESQKSFFSSNHRHYRWNIGFIRTFLFTDQSQPFELPLWEVRPWDLSLEIITKKGYSFSIAKDRKQKSLPVQLALTPQIQNNGDMGFYVGIYNTGFS